MKKKNFLKKALAVVVTIALMIGIPIIVDILFHKNGSIPTSAAVENGLYAYELAVQYGYEGTMQECLSH